MKLGNIKKVVAGILVGGALCGNAFAAETLFSNNVFEVAPAGVDGSLWAVSRNGSYSGVTLLTFRVSDKGTVALESTVRKQVSDTLTAVHNGIILDDDEFAERRRIPSVYAGEKLGLVLPMFSMDSDDRYLQPAGFFSVVDAKTVNEFPMDVPSNVEDFKDPMKYALSGFAYDSTGKRLWMARGALGVMVHDISSNKGSKDSTFVLNVVDSRLDPLQNNTVLDSTVYPEIFDVRLHPETGDLWLATAKGIWKRTLNGKVSRALNSSVLDTTVLDSMRVTGLWMGGNPLQIIAETNYKEKKNVVGGLWRIYGEKSEDFVKVDFLDTAGKVQKKDVYDEADYTVGDVAFLGNKAFVLVRTAGGSMSGYLKLDSLGVRAWEEDDDGKTQWLYGYETGATDRRAVIKSMCAFPLSKKRMGLAIATFGNGISVSADSGATWSVILNRAKLDNNLGSIRMVPSVITPGDEALVSYKVGRESKITIEVFSYDMRKVRTIVKDAVRNADAARSTNPKEDFWDGRDDHGKDCTMGVYYIRVKDNHGHIGWGKAITLGGNFR